jgi:hypothetical protein
MDAMYHILAYTLGIASASHPRVCQTLASISTIWQADEEREPGRRLLSARVEILLPSARDGDLAVIAPNLDQLISQCSSLVNCRTDLVPVVVHLDIVGVQCAVLVKMAQNIDFAITLKRLLQ